MMHITTETINHNQVNPCDLVSASFRLVSASTKSWYLRSAVNLASSSALTVSRADISSSLAAFSRFW